MNKPDKALKRDRLEARVSPEQKALFQRAAMLRGQTLSDYVVNIVQRDAEEIIHKHDLITLSARDSRIFVDALLNPRGPNDTLQAAFEDYREFTGQ
ncbi:MAG: DUF1778 domain-containing protein [Chloroflexi bacterium]|nr:DUF1778 domain-containing protein [Chloroflexota bacterium]